MKQTPVKKVLTLKGLTKSSVWDASENDIFRLMGKGSRDMEPGADAHHYLAIVRSAFLVEDIGDDENNLLKKKFEKLGYKVGTVALDEKHSSTWALKKRPIVKVTDLTYENIRHISASKLVEVMDCNFGGGWDSLSQSIKDIIESGFDISSTTLPHARLHKKGGMYDKKLAEGYEALCVEKGAWVEAVFVKAKPEPERPKVKISESDALLEEDPTSQELSPRTDDEQESVAEPAEEEMTEDNYSTMVDIVSDDTDEEASEIVDDEN